MSAVAIQFTGAGYSTALNAAWDARETVQFAHPGLYDLEYICVYRDGDGTYAFSSSWEPRCPVNRLTVS